MTRILTAALLAAAASLTVGSASALPLAALTTAPHLSAPACAPVTVLERRGEWSRVTLGETYGWVRDADLAEARCQQDADIALDARYVPREEATTAYA